MYRLINHLVVTLSVNKRYDMWFFCCGCSELSQAYGKYGLLAQRSLEQNETCMFIYLFLLT